MGIKITRDTMRAIVKRKWYLAADWDDLAIEHGLPCFDECKRAGYVPLSCDTGPLDAYVSICRAQIRWANRYLVTAGDTLRIRFAYVEDHPDYPRD